MNSDMFVIAFVVFFFSAFDGVPNVVDICIKYFVAYRPAPPRFIIFVLILKKVNTMFVDGYAIISTDQQERRVCVKYYIMNGFVDD